jgi:serine/threonine protein kinase
VLIDFDSAERSGTVSGRAGTRRYMAPEVARSARLLVELSQDFWSAGRLLEDLIPADASLSRFGRRARGMQRHLPQLRDGVEALLADMSAS